MNQAEVLCHSSGPWKKHKYFQKIGEGANAVYKYAKKAAGYAYGSKYREDMDKYSDAVDRAQKNMCDANEENWRLKSEEFINANTTGDGASTIMRGKQIRDELGRNQEYFDKQYAKAERAVNKSSNAADKYYKSLAYKVEKATGSYDKSRAERARSKGYEGIAEKHDEAYKKSAVVTVKTAAQETVAKGEAFINSLFKKN